MAAAAPASPAASGPQAERHEQLLAVLVESYFAAVDRMDLAATLACFTEDARVTIATFDTVYRGRDTEIQGMYRRLFARYSSVWHGDFDHVVQPPERVASQFTVRNVSPQGVRTVKHNCNFFRFRQGRICDMCVYMSGDNSLG